MHSSPWVEFYRRRVNNDASLVKFEDKYRGFFEMVLKEQPRSVAQLGCGIASAAKILHMRGLESEFTLVDNSLPMLNLAKRNLSGTGIKARYVWADARMRLAPRSELLFTHGLLEHWDDRSIDRFLASTMGSYRTAFHVVPSERYERPSLGDERLLSRGDWFRIARPTEIVELNDGFDLVLVFA